MPVVQKTVSCKKCGSVQCSWVQSKRTGRYYLAFCTPTHSIQVEGRVSGTSGWQVHPQTPHDCTDPVRGGFKACESCGKHHNVPLGVPAAQLPEWCARYADAKPSK